MIAPQVKLASTIRSLVSVAETLRSGLQHRDPETDEVLVHIKNTELYLKVSRSTQDDDSATAWKLTHFSYTPQVVSQLTNTYKLKGQDLLFNRQS